MELTGRYVFAAPIDRVWNLLMDTTAIAGCLPGCEAFEPLGDDRYRVKLNAGVAAITGSYEGMVAMTDKQPGVSYRLTVEGRGRPGFVVGESTVALAAEAEGVVVSVAATAQVGGLVAQVGQRLIGATARVMMDRFFECLRQRL